MIDFAGLGLHLNVNPIAFTIGGIPIYAYAVCIVFGIVLSLILCAKSQENFGISFDFLQQSLIFAILIGLIGARMYFVAFKWKNHKISLLQIFRVRDGGLAIYGGLIAGGIAIYLRCRKNKVNFYDVCDYLAPFVALAQSIGRWGNFFNQEAYGTETNNFLRMGIYTDFGYKQVHPTFLYESIACFLIFIFLRVMQKHRKFQGQIFYFYLYCYSGIRMLIEGVRCDSLMVKN